MNTTQAKTRVRFGVFELDVCAGELRKSGLKIKLQPQPLQVLLLLLERPGEVFTREELRQKLWQADIFVDFERSLNKAVVKLRESLGDSAQSPRYIETLPRLGYRFIAAVEEIDRSPTEVLPAPPALGDKDLSEVRGDGETPLALFGQAGDHSYPVGETGALETGGTRDDSRQKRRYPLALTTAALVAIAAFLFGLNVGGWRDRLLNRTRPAQIQSIAVLPVQNLSGDPNQEYFADGMTDELITDLAKIGSLRVISRTSVMRYKGTRESLPQIGRELNVDAIVEGSVMRSGDRVRITARLVQAPTDKHLWAETYERDLRDILGLQSEVARDISGEVRVKLTRQDQLNRSPHPVDPTAYEAYLRGRYELTRQDPKLFKEALAQFQRALEIDPVFAPAYSGLADTYNLFGNYGVIAPKEAFPRAEAAARKSLELDDTLAEAHASLGFAKHHYDWDWSGAESEYKRAIELSPSYAVAHLRYAEFLSTVARHDEALKEIRRGQELDPLSRVIGSNVGRVLFYGRRYDQAIQELRAALNLDPNNTHPRLNLGRAYEQKGMFTEAVQELKVVQASLGGGPLIALSHVYAVSGKRNLAKQMLTELEAEPDNTNWFFIAGLCAALDEKDQAFKYLSNAYDNHDFFLSFILVDPYMDPLRSDPRFQDLMRRLGLP
ncbi:MAG TPA: tetratricopeptide repeat protein [Terriglobia bacterium]|nr:tetratricopeptide repeat protein [Terriglobia bacterium]